MNLSRSIAWGMALLLLGNWLRANNLVVERLEMTGETTIQVEMAWDNAWHLSSGPANNDAVWIFVKAKAAGKWSTLPVVTGRSLTPNAVYTQPVPDQMGLFVIPEEGLVGRVNCTFTLELAAPLATGVEAIDVYGIEMVWVNEGAFDLGDGSSNGSLMEAGNGGVWRVESENTIPVGMDAGQLNHRDSEPLAGPIPADWPKGYAGFYCMKYEISQEQYADFLNALTFDQQTSRTARAPGSEVGTLALTSGPAFRNAIRIRVPGTAGSPAVYGCDREDDAAFDGPTDAQARACNFLNWGDVTAYLDWAGLAPLTELEYEKACRGPQPAISNEFAWGTANAVDANTLLADGSATETVAEQPPAPAGLASHGYDGPQGPLRCGFAAHSGSDRLLAGAAYYGPLELSGNLWEQVVVVNPVGLGYTGTPGDGRLSSSGRANEADWPAAAGAGFRGGGWNSGIVPGFRDLAVSDRFYVDLAPEVRRNTTGGRGGRR